MSAGTMNMTRNETKPTGGTSEQKGLFHVLIEKFRDNVTDPHTSVFLPLSVIVFMFLVLRGSRAFIQVSSYLMGIKGFVLLIFPEIVLRNIVEGQFDPVHLEEVRCNGIILISFMLTYIAAARKSQDQTVWATLMWSRTIFCALQLMLQINEIYEYNSYGDKDPKIPYNLVRLGLHNSVLLFGGHLYYAMTESDWGGHAELKNLRNGILRFDFAMLLITGVIFYCIPNQALKMITDINLNHLHEYFCRCFGAASLAVAITAGRSSNFLNEDDKRGVLLSHGLTNLMLFFTFLACQLLTRTFSHWHIVTSMVIVLIMAIVDLTGCDWPWLVKGAKSFIQPLIPKSKMQ